MKLLRVNMESLETSFEDLPEKWKLLGGRRLTAEILNAEVPPKTGPLSPAAKLIIAGGPLAGTLAPGAGRISLGAKSPLTMGIKESNSGGPAAQKMDRLGIRAIVVEGAPGEKKLYLLKISKNGVALESADAFKGMKNYELTKAVHQQFQNRPSLLSISIPGERGSKTANVALTDKDGHASRHAARGGLGAVMGAKGLKLIIIDDSGTSPVDIADRDLFKKAIKDWSGLCKTDQTLGMLSQFGTPGGVIAMGSLGSMPSKNYSNESTEGFEKLGGTSFMEANLERGGKMDICMPGCQVGCAVVYHGADKKHLTSGLEFETLALMGMNLGISDPDAVAGFDRTCDDLGIDSIELGAALGVAASAGKIEMGNIEDVQAMIDEVEKGTEFGRILADGVVATCKALGVTRIPAVKGQAMPGHDPRVTHVTGITYCTSPMGADHTAGVSYRKLGSKNGRAERSLKEQIFSATMDALGYCSLSTLSDRKTHMAFLADLINARYNLEISAEDLINTGRDTLRAELKFNAESEFSRIHDPDPEYIRHEPLGPMGNLFDVDPEEIAAIWAQLDTIEVI